MKLSFGDEYYFVVISYPLYFQQYVPIKTAEIIFEIITKNNSIKIIILNLTIEWIKILI